MENIIWNTAAFNYISFVVAAIVYFKTNQSPTSSVYLTKSTALISAALQLYYLKINTQPNMNLQATSEGLFVMSFLLFGLALLSNRKHRLSEIYSTDAPKFLNRTGPYRYLRHPFYVSYLMSYLAGFVATLNPILFAQFAAMVFIYWKAAKFEEGKFSQSNLKTDYLNYTKKTGMFIPKFF